MEFLFDLILLSPLRINRSWLLFAWSLILTSSILTCSIIRWPTTAYNQSISFWPYFPVSYAWHLCPLGSGCDLNRDYLVSVKNRSALHFTTRLTRFSEDYLLALATVILSCGAPRDPLTNVCESQALNLILSFTTSGCEISYGQWSAQNSLRLQISSLLTMDIINTTSQRALCIRSR